MSAQRMRGAPALGVLMGLVLMGRSLVACSERAPPPVAPAATASLASSPAAVASAAAPAPTASVAAPAVVSTSADRLPPPAVPPVQRDGVRYSQAEDGRRLGLSQVGGVLVASDAASGTQRWVLPVYDNTPKPGLEGDAQWLFFTSMAFDPDGRLRIVNEAGKAYLVDVKSRTVTPVP